MLKFDLTYEQMYKMTFKELYKTLEQRKKGLAYKIWKEANLNMLATADIWRGKGKKPQFPDKPEKASPELYPPPVTIKRPEGLPPSCK